MYKKLWNLSIKTNMFAQSNTPSLYTPLYQKYSSLAHLIVLVNYYPKFCLPCYVVFSVLYYTALCEFACRYEEKRWVPRDGKPKSPSRVQEEKTASYGQKTEGANAHSYASNSENLFKERRNAPQAAITKPSIPAPKISFPSPPKGPGQVLSSYILQSKIEGDSFLDEEVQTYTRREISILAGHSCYEAHGG